VNYKTNATIKISKFKVRTIYFSSSLIKFQYFI